MKIEISFSGVGIQEMNDLKIIFGDKLTIKDFEKKSQKFSGSILLLLGINWKESNSTLVEQIIRIVSNHHIVYPNVLLTSIETHNFSKQLKKVLRENNILTIRDLTEKTPRELHEMKGLGNKFFTEITEFLNSYNLRLTISKQRDQL